MLAILTCDIQEYPQIFEIREAINYIYELLNQKNYDLVIDSVNTALEKCNYLKEQAINNQNEEIANSSFVIKNYLKLLENYSKYWDYLGNRKYKETWNLLQNCIDNLINICRFSRERTLFDLNLWEEHLRELEKLYPYRVFGSSEMIKRNEVCSICGLSITDPSCDHIPGQLYWGKMAKIIAGNIEFQAVALVKRPLDKRCIMEIAEDNIPEEEKFKLLVYFSENNSDPLRLFRIEEIPTMYLNDMYRSYERNDRCPCSSGKKFKKCCGQNKYEEGTHYKIIIQDRIPMKPVSIYCNY